MGQKGHDDHVGNEVRERMTNLLKKGNKLLAEYCPKCGTPLFYIKERGLKYCAKCQVYLATEEEIEKKEIDTAKESIYDFDKYWDQKKRGEPKEAEVQEPSKTRKAVKKTFQKQKDVKTQQAATQELQRSEIPKHVSSNLDNVLAMLLDQLRVKIEERELSSEKILEWIERLAKIRDHLKEKNVK